MVRPLKDIVAELEAKHKERQLDTLEDRSRIIHDYDASIEYLLQSMDNYIKEVNYTIEHNLSVSIISRSTQNLIFQIVHSHNLLIPYSYNLTVCLMDERYDENYRFWKDFEDKGEKILRLIEKLDENNIFNFKDIDKDTILQSYHIIQGFGGKVPPSVGQEIKLSYLNGAELLSCLEYMIDMMGDELAVMKMSQILRVKDEDILSKHYEINYLLYAKEYWPDQERGFRSHRIKYRLRGNVSIGRIEELRDEKVRDFENNTAVGKIWRDYSEDTIRMAAKLKETIKTDDEWIYFFQAIFEIEEYDRWIDELHNNDTAQSKAKGKGGRPRRAGKNINKAFRYEVGDETQTRLQLLFNGLISLGWICQNTDLRSFLNIFSGGETTIRIVWTGDINALTELFQELVTRKQFVQLPQGESIWLMVNARFWDHEGNKEFGNTRLGSTRPPKEAKDSIDLLVKIMNPATSLNEIRKSMQSQ